jgi:hypothetical protein
LLACPAKILSLSADDVEIAGDLRVFCRELIVEVPAGLFDQRCRQGFC